MMNNTIADDLIYGQKNSVRTDMQTQGNTPNIQNREEEIVDGRVESTRYKIYVLLFLLIGLLLFYKFLLPTYDEKKSADLALEGMQAQLDSFESKKKRAEKNLALLKIMEEKEKDIIACINNSENDKKDIDKSIDKRTEKDSDFSENCKILSEYSKEEIRDYLNINTLSNKKMVIDEKKILSNLNDFLLRKKGGGEYNGTIEAVYIGEEDNFDKNIFYSPLNLRIAFDNKDDLLSFVDNIEKRILEQKEYRILYQIENIKYDILKSQEKQSVEIAMNMFYTR